MTETTGQMTWEPIEVMTKRPNEDFLVFGPGWGGPLVGYFSPTEGRVLLRDTDVSVWDVEGKHEEAMHEQGLFPATDCLRFPPPPLF